MSNTVWHVALRPGTTEMQDVIVVNLQAEDTALLNLLLETNRLKGKIMETEKGDFLLMYGGEYHRPYPGIMIWKLMIDGEKSMLCDIDRKDAWVPEKRQQGHVHRCEAGRSHSGFLRQRTCR